MKWPFALLLCVSAVLVLAGCTTKANRISLDFPQGELRLLVQRIGDTLLFYGALPKPQAIPSGIFDIDELFTQLQTRLHEVVSTEKRPLGQPYAAVTIWLNDGGSRAYILYDGDYAGEIFKQACQHRVREVASSAAIFEKACAAIVGTMP
ncbi:MAG: hypothetical protein ACN4GM_09220 [Gammaproteobacteria bacterium]